MVLDLPRASTQRLPPTRQPGLFPSDPGRWGAYRARPPVNSRARSDNTGHDDDRPLTVFVLAKSGSRCVAGQGFEPWKASADGFTVRSHMHFRRS